MFFYLIRFTVSKRAKWLILAALLVLVLGCTAVFVYFTQFEEKTQTKIFNGNAVVSNGEECAEIGM